MQACQVHDVGSHFICPGSLGGASRMAQHAVGGGAIALLWALPQPHKPRRQLSTIIANEKSSRVLWVCECH